MFQQKREILTLRNFVPIRANKNTGIMSSYAQIFVNND